MFYFIFYEESYFNIYIWISLLIIIEKYFIYLVIILSFYPFLVFIYYLFSVACVSMRFFFLTEFTKKIGDKKIPLTLKK